MWTATITEIVKEGAVAVVSVDFDQKGSPTFTYTYRLSDPESLKRILSDQIAQLDRIDAFVAQQPLGVVDLTPAEVVIVPPTQDELDNLAYEKKYQELVQAKLELDLKIINQSAYDAKLAELAALKH